MSGFGILMMIFSVCVFLVGLYMYTGHRLGIVSWRVPFKNLTISEWKNIGKWSIITSIFIFIIATIALILNLE